MRRRIPSAALRVHRYSLPQILVDGLLVALAWHLAFTLRFDPGVPSRYERLLDATYVPVVAGTLVLFFVLGLYQRRWSLLGLRDYEQVVRAVVVAVLAMVGYIVLLHPVEIFVRGGVGRAAVSPPLGVIALYFLLLLAFTCGARFVVRAVLERPQRWFRAGKDARDVLIVGAGDGGRLGLRGTRRNAGLD